MELSKTEKAQDSCGGDLEDALLSSETDKAVALHNIARALDRIRLAERPCRWYEFSCKRRAKQLRQPLPTNGN